MCFDLAVTSSPPISCLVREVTRFRDIASERLALAANPLPRFSIRRLVPYLISTGFPIHRLFCLQHSKERQLKLVLKVASNCGVCQIAGSSFELLAQDFVHTSQRHFSPGGIVDITSVPAPEFGCSLYSKIPRGNGQVLLGKTAPHS